MRNVKGFPFPIRVNSRRLDQSDIWNWLDNLGYHNYFIDYSSGIYFRNEPDALAFTLRFGL